MENIIRYLLGMILGSIAGCLCYWITKEPGATFVLTWLVFNDWIKETK